jgi:phospholipase C
MSKSGRRDFLKAIGAGTLAASLPATISRALATPANDRTRSIQDVEHIIIRCRKIDPSTTFSARSTA